MLDLLKVIREGKEALRDRTKAEKKESSSIMPSNIMPSSNTKCIVKGFMCTHKEVDSLNSTALFIARVYTCDELHDMINSTRRSICFLSSSNVYSRERMVLLGYCKHNQLLVNKLANAYSSLMVRLVARDVLALLLASNDIQLDEIEAHEKY